ncbi:MAG: DNA-processing protein DprA [Pseudomonadota bacterium]|nr:DNA-processing protein DprA [Pseudomonadota bacterium]
MVIDGRAEAWVRLHCAGFSAQVLATLLRHFGSPEGVLAATPAQRAVHVASRSLQASSATEMSQRVDATLAWLAGPSHRVVAWDDAEYPAALLELSDPPIVLYAIGDAALLARPALAIVGSRNATSQGCLDAEAFAGALSDAGLTIVSGLALGIDAAAHRGALRGPGRTIAIMGTGPDRIYPARNRDLALAIAEQGLLLSEFLPGTPPLKPNFPRRNRIISGIAKGVLVVEATLSSGSLITARLAAEQGREVFALPGSIHSPFARGCHRLIRDGAKLVETSDDILEELRFPAASARTEPSRVTASGDEHPADGRSGEAGEGDRLASREDGSRDDTKRVWDALGSESLDIDTLASRALLSAPHTTAALTLLEIDGRVARLPGGQWQRLV